MHLLLQAQRLAQRARTAAKIDVTQFTVAGRTNAGVCVDGKKSSVKIVRRTPAMNVASVAGSGSETISPPFQLSGRRYDQ